MLVKELIRVSTRNTFFAIKSGSIKYEGFTNNVPFKFWELEVLRIGTNEKGIVIECKSEE